MKNCPTGASHVNEGGVVLVTHGKCSGCKACIAACPYDARFVHPKGYVDKCTFCLHRVQAGFLPACVERLPDRDARLRRPERPGVAGRRRTSRTRRWKVNHPESGAQPNLYFLL